MEQFIVLLRGVNVGGKNAISMPALCSSLASFGFTDPKSYINSGNILLKSTGTTSQVIAGCQQVIQQEFGLSIAACAIPAKQLASALAQAPSWWNQDPGSKHNLIFTIPPYTAATIIQEVGSHKPEYEDIAAIEPVIFWSAPLKTFSKTRWSKVSQTKAYPYITIRNANTAYKLVQLSQA